MPLFEEEVIGFEFVDLNWKIMRINHQQHQLH
jgi:hypothetical protein